MFDIYELDIVSDIATEYENLKSDGETKIDAIIMENYEDELSDVDDQPFVYIALALCHLKYKGKVGANLMPRVLEALEAVSLTQRFSDVENEGLFEEFCQWRDSFRNDVINGVPVIKKTERKRYKKMPKMNKGDIFCCDFEDETNKVYGTVLLIVVDFTDFLRKDDPVVYLACTPKAVYTTEDIRTEDLVFLPVSRRFKHFDYREILTDRSISLDIGMNLRYIGNLTEIPCPEVESIPPKDLYALAGFKFLSDSIKRKMDMLKNPPPTSGVKPFLADAEEDSPQKRMEFFLGLAKFQNKDF